MSKRPSLRKNINKMCKQCIYDPIGSQGTWRQQVEACTSKDCPLYAVRPVSSGEKQEAESITTGEGGGE